MVKLIPSNVYFESRTILNSVLRDNLTDPKLGRKNSSRRWIYRTEPDTTSQDFEGYPTIILESPDLTEDNQDLLHSTSDTELSFNLEVATEFNDPDARLDTISSEIHAIFKSFTNLNLFAQNNMFEPTVTSSPGARVQRDLKQLMVRNFIITFQTTQEAV